MEMQYWLVLTLDNQSEWIQFDDRKERLDALILLNDEKIEGLSYEAKTFMVNEELENEMQ